MIEVWVVWSPLIYDMTPKYVVGWLGWTWVDLIFDPSCMVIFESSVSDFINKEFFESKSHVIMYHAHLLVSRALPTK